ncbi:Hypothetical protein HDN1F_24610 [gamma proteobacterium HdN1]|nr:Hypothetical protein HDN1F_24610 [gamma proteobacterium HdN1]
MPQRNAPYWRPDPYFRRIALIAVLFVLPSLWVGLQLDDYFHWALVQHLPELPVDHLRGSPFHLFGFLDGDAQRAQTLMEKGMLPWWSLQDIRYAFWRPLVEFSHALDYSLWPHSPWLMHLQSIVWFVLVLWLAHRLFDLLLGSDAARWATLAFALHYSHGLPVGWLANRNAVIASFFVLLTVLLHHRVQGRFSAAGLLAFAAALLCGELGVSAGLILFAYALTLDRGNLTARALSLLPYVLVGVVWLGLRKWFGYGAQGSGHYLDPLQDPAGFFAAFSQRAADLLNGQFLLIPPELATLLPLPVRAFAAILIFGFLAVYGWRLARGNPVARFFVLATLLCILPVTATTPHSRLLFCVSIGGCGLVGVWLAELRNRARALQQEGSAKQHIHKAAGIILVCLFCGISPLLLAFESASMRLFMDGMINNGARNLSWDASNAQQRLILVNPPLTSVAGYLGGIRAWYGLDYPKHSYTLVSGLNAATVSVVDDHSLRVISPKGVYDVAQETLLRSPAKALSVGDTVQLQDMQVTVEVLTGEKIPSQILLRFTKPLNDPQYRFMLWNRGKPVDCQWPAVGATLELTLASASCLNPPTVEPEETADSAKTADTEQAGAE